MLLWKVVYSRIEPNIPEYFWGRCWGTDKYTALLIWNQPSWNASKRKFWACQIFCLNCKANHEDRDVTNTEDIIDEIRANHNHFIGKCKNQWRIRQGDKTQNIINHIKTQRLSRFGHIQRMPDTRTVKKIFNWKPLTKRSQGRPKYRWEDNIKQDICQMKIKNWIACVQDRGKWK